MDDVPLSCVEIIDECTKWLHRTPELAETIKHAALATLKAEGRQGAVAILLADARHVQELNARFRNKDAPTNVLSFPAGDRSNQSAELEEYQSLGDIILSYETVMHEATVQNKCFADHTIHLVVHGMLHILGYDHQNESDTILMTNREINILASLNISDPYAEVAI